MKRDEKERGAAAGTMAVMFILIFALYTYFTEG